MSHTEVTPDEQAGPDAEKLPGRGWRVVLSLFIVLNISTVLYVSLPPAWAARKHAEWTADWAPMAKYRLSLVHWRWQQYAHLAGLNNVWQMFGKQSEFNWHYDIRGVYGSGKAEKWVLLPLPGQSKRTWAQTYIFDFRQRKLDLNIYRDEFARQACMRYLARLYPEHEGMPLTKIRWNLRYQMILPPDEAVRRQKLVSDDWHTIDFGRYTLPTKEEAPR
ncbi:MAG: hypothetical protein IPK32_02200 [Verrucomicrobiaceae bacterium]|nr:hypothetical protein [Verrucomicrobiaceae bacterium]